MEKSMNEINAKATEAASLKRLLVNRVIVTAVFCLAVTGGLALLFYSDILFDLRNLPLRLSLNNIVPGLFDIGLLLICAALLLWFVFYFTLRKTFAQISELASLPAKTPEPDWQAGKTIEDLIDKAPPAPSPQPIPAQPANKDAILLQLESEKILNNLLSALLSKNTTASAAGLDEVLASLGSYCKSDFTAIYKKEVLSGMFDRLGFWDADPDTARHSNKLDAIELPQYRWMNKSLLSGKSFIFRTAMLNGLMQGIQNAADDVKEWMQMQAQESAEYKLCRHEGWEYFVCFPCLQGNDIIGLFIIGYFKPELPITNDVLERLTLISTALGRQLSEFDGKETPSDAATDIQAALDTLDEAIFITDQAGVLTLLNKSASALVESRQGRLAGQPWHSVFHLINKDTGFPVPNPVAKFSRDSSEKIYLDNVAILGPAGAEILLEGMAAPFYYSTSDRTGIIFILRDVTDRTKQEIERSQAQRMEAISSLSAGFAHDFNNILTAILGNISLAMDDAPPNSEQASVLKAAEESTLKGKEITDNLLAMAKGSPIPEHSSEAIQTLQRVVNEMVTGTNVKPVFQFAPSLPNIRMAVDTFEKIITNLVSNALQAMKLGGILTVTAEPFNAVADTEIQVKPGHYLCIHIKDTGEGITSDNQNRVFVPYFTTRPQASGLGLPIVYQLLKKNSGFIRLKSQPGKGTDCEIYIPVAEDKAELLPDTKSEPKPASLRSAPFVLVLDEDDALGNLLIKTLVKMGLKVQHTTNTDELTSLFFKAANSGSPVTLILADLNMPSLIDIRNLLNVLKKSDPKVKLVAYSNQIGPENLEEYKSKGFDDILQKPFNISDLRAVINRNIEV